MACSADAVEMLRAAGRKIYESFEPNTYPPCSYHARAEDATLEPDVQYWSMWEEV